MPPDFTAASAYFDSWNIRLDDKLCVTRPNQDKGVADIFTGQYEDLQWGIQECEVVILLNNNIISEVLP